MGAGIMAQGWTRPSSFLKASSLVGVLIRIQSTGQAQKEGLNPSRMAISDCSRYLPWGGRCISSWAGLWSAGLVLPVFPPPALAEGVLGGDFGRRVVVGLVGDGVALGLAQQVGLVEM